MQIRITKLNREREEKKIKNVVGFVKNKKKEVEEAGERGITTPPWQSTMAAFIKILVDFFSTLEFFFYFIF